ncbi:calcineurin B-like protein 4 [Tanacetum coccineum]
MNGNRSKTHESFGEISAVESCIIFKNKMKADGTIDKYKARLVVKRFRQREGLDFFDTYLPVTRITSIRMVLAIAALRKLEVHQMDMKMTFLNEDLENVLYTNQPEGFVAPGLESKVKPNPVDWRSQDLGSIGQPNHRNVGEASLEWLNGKKPLKVK